METKNKTVINWIAIVLGVVVCALGMMSVFQDDAVNNAMVETGAGQMAVSLISEYPESEKILNTAALTIQNAVQAREGDPQAICRMVQERLEAVGIGMNVTPIVSAVVNQINAAYEASANEEQFHDKLKLLARGILNVTKGI